MSRTKLPSPLDQLDDNDVVQRTFSTGESLFIQDDPTAGLFYLVKGTVDLTRVTKSGHSVTIHRARSGDTFAEASLFSDTYHCTATAVRDMRVTECKRSAILGLMDTDSAFSKALVARFASQIQEGRRRVELLSIRAADERILTALNDGLLVEDISSFADLIGLASETVYRVLAQLSQSGQIVKTARGQYRALE